MVFVDTSFWAALMIPRDARHPESVELLMHLADRPAVTTNQVRGETWTLLTRRVGHWLGIAFLDRLEATPRLELAFLDRSLEDEAIAWLRRHDERPYSYVDATSFAVMRTRGIQEALVFDADFTAAGFLELRA